MEDKQTEIRKSQALADMWEGEAGEALRSVFGDLRAEMASSRLAATEPHVLWWAVGAERMLAELENRLKDSVNRAIRLSKAKQ